MTPTATSWTEANQRHLAAALGRVRRSLERHAGMPASDGPAHEGDPATASALDRLCELFGLSGFERDVLALCAGVELDGSFPVLCAEAQGDPRRPYPSFGLALATLDEPHWSAVAPGSPLRRWRLVALDAGEPVTAARLRIDERVLHHLTGVDYLDDRLAGLLHPLDPPMDLLPTHGRAAQRLASTWARETSGPLPAAVLCGDDRAAVEAAAAAACAACGLGLYRIAAGALPADRRELDELARLATRECALSAAALVIDAHGADPSEAGRIADLVDVIGAPVAIAGPAPLRLRRRRSVTLDVGEPPPDERRALWRDALGPAARTLNGHVPALAAHFAMSALEVRSACAEAMEAAGPEGPELGVALWDAARRHSRPGLDDLAQRLEPRARWEDLVLPAAQTEVLRGIALHVRHRATVYEDWGWASVSSRGLGVAALFSGPSGTGKTMAAEVLAGNLRLDLYRIDLAQVVSKYIGETEKNLRRVFDAAEGSGAILLFDEADALFGRRTEVKDSHDRYANIEVGYLLQRMEAYRGLAILTTNARASIDPAFLRRIRFMVSFPFPAAGHREALWRRAFPPETPTEGLDPARLARLAVAGGTIRNIALAATFLAAEAGRPVRMTHLAAAARAELIKAERPVAEAEIGGWA